MAGLFDLTGFLKPVISRLADYIPDPAQKAKAEAEATTEILNYVASQNLEQIKVDAAEAASHSIWVAGWRPAVGWTCAASLFWNYVGVNVANWLIVLIHPNAALLTTTPMGDLKTILLSLLGIGFGGLRTLEKFKGIAPPGAQ